MPEHRADSPGPIIFGKYLLDEELARGGMSRVFLARLQGPGGFEKRLVVKQILPELAADPEFVELFVQEANTLVQLSHPNLVPVYELGVVDGVYFLAMEWVKGATVDQLLLNGPLPAALVAHIGAQIAEALSYAHASFRIVHRDVTPRNVIVDARGHARLLDFGIAAPAERTGRGGLFGSPGYMAPEQLRGEPLGPESDLFGLGCVLYEALSNKPAWPATRTAEDFAQSPPPTPLEGPAVDAELAGLVHDLLGSDRTTRPQPAAAVADRLRTWLAANHPRGVLPALSERVSSAEAAVAALPRPHAEPPRVSSGRIEVRSIAVNRELSALLQQATERLERRPEPVPVDHTPEAEPEPTLGNDPEGHRVARRFLRDIAIVTLALFVALFYARMQRDEPDVSEGTYEEALPPTATATAPEPVPPAAGPDTPELAPLDQPKATEAPAQEAEPTPAANSGSVVSDEAKRGGFVTVSAVPWAQVRLDGKLLGTTPRRSLPVRAGKHVLQLSCPPLAHETQLAVEVVAGQELRVSANMHESPPQVEVR
ncbi:MAG: protein kinase [Polyangiales bacterium]